MKKRVMIAFAMALILCLALAATASAETKTIILKIGDPNMTVNGVTQEIDPARGTKPLVVKGRTLVPIRTIVENMGGTIAWDGGTQQVTITANNKTIRMTLNYAQAEIKSQADSSTWAPKKMDVAPQSINGRTMVPLRFVTEELGATVNWDAATKTVTITFAVTAFDPLNWTGSWDTNSGVLILNQSGTAVASTNDNYWGKITGTVSGKTLTGKWFINVSDQGDILFTLSDDGKSFTGKWRYNYPGETPPSEEDGGGWIADVVGQR